MMCKSDGIRTLTTQIKMTFLKFVYVKTKIEGWIPRLGLECLRTCDVDFSNVTQSHNECVCGHMLKIFRSIRKHSNPNRGIQPSNFRFHINRFKKCHLR